MDRRAATLVVLLAGAVGAQGRLPGDPQRIASATADRLLARGLASVYEPGVGYGGADLVGCPAATLRLYGTRRLTMARARALARDGLHVVALRPGMAACGTLVTVVGRGRTAPAIVLDRGPFGQRCPSRPWLWSLRLLPGCAWRGVADLPVELGRLVLPTSRSRRLHYLSMGVVEVRAVTRMLARAPAAQDARSATGTTAGPSSAAR